MEDCGCKNSEIVAFIIISIILGIVAGISVGLLFFLGLIPSIINLIRIALVMSVIALGIILLCLYTSNIIRGCNSFKRCTYKFAKLSLVVAFGTLISATITAVIGVTVVSTLSTIFVGITTLFFVIIILSIIGYYNCLIEETYV